MPLDKHFFARFLILFLLMAYSALGAPQGRVIILGFDGMDPGIVQGMIDKNELPSFAKLSKEGSFLPLASSNPPQSPTAWSNFATCRRPVHHGVFDFLRRDPNTYFPSPGFGSTKRPDLAPDGALLRGPVYESKRKGDSFWKVTSDAGKKVKALTVPYAYPAEPLGEGCCELCGLDVPDIRGTQSIYFAFSEDFATVESIAGGMRIPLRFENDLAVVNVPGIAPAKSDKYAEVPVTFKADRSGKNVEITVENQSVKIKQGEWSSWLEWTFALSPAYKVRAISQFHLVEAGNNVRLYMTCLQIHPREPMMPISTPPEYAAELADRYGLYKTVGWSHDTKALQSSDMTEDMFLEDAKRTVEWNKQLTLDELDRGGFDMLLSGWTATDRISHLFWAYRDPKHPLYTEQMSQKYGRVVEDSYIQADVIVGEVMKRLKENDLLMIMSDHGFHSFRYGFNVNTWLVRNGYLAIKGLSDPATAFTDAKYLMDFDWPRSKAYALGLGMIFLNLKGREKYGTVTPEEAPAVLEEIKEKLLALTDPKTSDKIFRNIYVMANVQGESAADAPDLQLGYADGYQTGKISASGAAPKEVIEPNLDKWSGEHAGSDVDLTPGIFFCNKKVSGQPTLLDLGVSALTYLDTPVPKAFEGKPLIVQ
ncbi:MAG TPA: alkaline phosphatase family protein [Candidatus Hydrogenedentes bacterium]|nr:alkaline phosphatase family protein [Candidatus Hydrogenedentota bacterium]